MNETTANAIGAVPGRATAREAVANSFQFDALAEAVNYRKGLIRELAPYLRGRVLEVGAGIGHFTSLLRCLSAIELVKAVEPDKTFCQELRRQFPSLSLIEGTIQQVTENGWDAILSVNVLEHIEDDRGELSRYKQLLAPGTGTLNLFVPACQEIYAPIDGDFGHYRRYSMAELKTKLENAGFEIVRLRYFSFVGYFLWLVNFRLLKKRCFDARAIRFYDRFIFPGVHCFETNVLAPPFGQSLLAVARARK